MILLMKSDKTTWGYCDCSPTRHCRKDPTLCSNTESFQISTLSLKTCGIVCWAPCPNKNTQSEEEREETERWRMERLNWEYKDIDGVGLYNFYKLSSLRVDDVARYFSHYKITFKVKKAEKVAVIIAQIGRLLYVQLYGALTTAAARVKKCATTSDLLWLFEVETNSQSDVVENNLDWSWLVALLVRTSLNVPNPLHVY